MSRAFNLGSWKSLLTLMPLWQSGPLCDPGFWLGCQSHFLQHSCSVSTLTQGCWEVQFSAASHSLSFPFSPSSHKVLQYNFLFPILSSPLALSLSFPSSFSHVLSLSLPESWWWWHETAEMWAEGYTSNVLSLWSKQASDTGRQQSCYLLTV